jgi:hypothetical protein
MTVCWVLRSVRVLFIDHKVLAKSAYGAVLKFSS